MAEGKRMLTFEAPGPVADLLTAAAKAAGCSRSALIRRAAAREAVRVMERASGLEPKPAELDAAEPEAA